MNQKKSKRLREKTPRRPLLIDQQRIIESFELGLDLRALHIVPNTGQVRRKDCSRNGERVACPGHRDHIVGVNQLAAKRGRDLSRASPDRQHSRSGSTPEIELCEAPSDRDALRDHPYRNRLTESRQNGVHVLKQRRLVDSAMQAR